MIVERECRVVVMLCGLEEDGNVCYHKLCLVNNNDCVCYRKCVTSTGLLLLLPQELRNTMNLVLNVNRRIAVVVTLRVSEMIRLQNFIPTAPKYVVVPDRLSQLEV